jgi:hypothetical protein
MAITEPYELDGVTVVTVISIVSGNSTPQSITDDGVYQLWVDGSAMVKGDEFRIDIKEKVEATGGVQITVFSATLSDVQSEVFVSPMLILLHGWDMLITKVSATNRAFDASIRKIA